MTFSMFAIQYKTENAVQNYILAMNLENAQSTIDDTTKGASDYILGNFTVIPCTPKHCNNIVIWKYLGLKLKLRAL